MSLFTVFGFKFDTRVILSFLLLVSFAGLTQAQSPTTQAPPVSTPSPTEQVVTSAQPAPVTPTTGADRAAEALQSRIGRARALVAAHHLEIAASELESVRAAAKDNAVRNIASIMLMNVYLEEGNYSRAEALLEETFQARQAQKDESLGTYFALAGQAVNGARSHLARYRTFGVSTSAESLPAEVQTDLNRLRTLLERMVAQAKEISKDRLGYDSLSLLEDVVGLRLSLATDTEDQAKWQGEYANARESLASTQTQIASLGGIPPLRPSKTPVNTSTLSPYSTKKAPDGPPDVTLPTKGDAVAAQVVPPPTVAQPANSNATEKQADSNGNEEEVNDAGSLNAFATKKVVPRYPVIAKQSGASGMVRVHVVVEAGKVVTIKRSEGPMLLRQAAEDAARQWMFQVISVEGRPTRLSGYIDFNFTL